MSRKRVGILIFPSVEVLDFCGPFEVLVVAEERGVTVAAGGLKVIPNCTLDDCPPLDILYPDDNTRRVEVTPRRAGRWWHRWRGIPKPESPR